MMPRPPDYIGLLTQPGYAPTLVWFDEAPSSHAGCETILKRSPYRFDEHLTYSIYSTRIWFRNGATAEESRLGQLLRAALGEDAYFGAGARLLITTRGEAMLAQMFTDR